MTLVVVPLGKPLTQMFLWCWQCSDQFSSGLTRLTVRLLLLDQLNIDNGCSNTWTQERMTSKHQARKKWFGSFGKKERLATYSQTLTNTIKCEKVFASMSRAANLFDLEVTSSWENVPTCLSLRMMRKALGRPVKACFLPARCRAETWIWLIAFTINGLATTTMTVLTHRWYLLAREIVFTARHVETGWRERGR